MGAFRPRRRPAAWLRGSTVGGLIQRPANRSHNGTHSLYERNGRRESFVQRRSGAVSPENPRCANDLAIGNRSHDGPHGCANDFPSRIRPHNPRASGPWQFGCRKRAHALEIRWLLSIRWSKAWRGVNLGAEIMLSATKLTGKGPTEDQGHAFGAQIDSPALSVGSRLRLCGRGGLRRPGQPTRQSPLPGP